MIISEDSQRSLKSSEELRRCPKSAKGEVIEKTLIHKIRDREEGIVIYSFYTWFSFLTWVWVNIFLEIVSSKTATTHIFQSGMRNWPLSVSRREIEVLNPQAMRVGRYINVILLSDHLCLSLSLSSLFTCVWYKVFFYNFGWWVFVFIELVNI